LWYFWKVFAVEISNVDNISNEINKRLINIVQEKFTKMAQDITPFTSFYIFLLSSIVYDKSVNDVISCGTFGKYLQ
jgi:MFS-type transporter involved in bile tolerance (Atg22 family)